MALVLGLLKLLGQIFQFVFYAKDRWHHHNYQLAVGWSPTSGGLNSWSLIKTQGQELRHIPIFNISHGYL